MARPAQSRRPQSVCAGGAGEGSRRGEQAGTAAGDARRVRVGLRRQTGHSDMWAAAASAAQSSAAPTSSSVWMALTVAAALGSQATRKGMNAALQRRQVSNNREVAGCGGGAAQTGPQVHAAAGAASSPSWLLSAVPSNHAHAAVVRAALHPGCSCTLVRAAGALPPLPARRLRLTCPASSALPLCR